MDFIEEPAEDGFFTFTQYKDDPDKRFLPTRCGGDGRWGGMITTALTGVPWTPDDVSTYLDRMDPANCGGGGYPPVETGVQVKRPRKDPTTYNEKVCIQPGCHYVPTGVSSGSCEP